MTRPLETSVTRTLPFSSDAELRRRFMIGSEPLRANLRWGLLLEVLDKLAEDCALAYVHRTLPGARVVTAAIDEIVLRNPADLGRDLNLHARINHVGRSSMEVGMRVDQAGPGQPSLASCYFTMVARSGDPDDEVSLTVPPLDYVDQLEIFRYHAVIASREAYRRQQAALLDPPGRDEYRMLKELHLAQEEPGFAGALVADLVQGNWERMYPEQENVPRKIFGGHLIRRALELAVVHAERIAPLRPVVVQVNRINFLQPVRIGDTLHYSSRVVYTGDTSICVEVDIERLSRDRETRALSNTCIFTFVNVDENLMPRPVPKVYPTTYAEDERYLEAHRRRLRHRRHRKTDRTTSSIL